jgi:hypothetical protein
MATFISKDAVITTDLTPVDEQANLSFIDTPSQSVMTNAGKASKLVGEVKGFLGLSGGVFSKSDFTFAAVGNKAIIQGVGTTIQQTSLTGDNADDTFRIGGPGVEFSDPSLTSSTSAVDAKMGSGNDSVRFLNRTFETASSFNMGKGGDTVTFGKRATLSGTTIKLGSDSDADKVTLANEVVTEGVKITQFGRQDELTVGGKTYTYTDIKKAGGVVDGITVQLD